MKIQFLSAAALLLLLAQTTISCNSCEDRNNDPIPTQTPEVGAGTSADYDDAAFDDGNSTSIDASSSTIENQGNTSTTTTKTSNTTRVGTAPAGKTTSKPPRPQKETWSAPNGTDAENHDGDPYTKHDTTSMPTGTIR